MKAAKRKGLPAYALDCTRDYVLKNHSQHAITVSHMAIVYAIL